MWFYAMILNTHTAIVYMQKMKVEANNVGEVARKVCDNNTLSSKNDR